MGFKNGMFFGDNGDKLETEESEHESAEQVMTEGDLGKVRDLLFGGQIREQRHEMARLEAEIIQQTSVPTRGHGQERRFAREPGERRQE